MATGVTGNVRGRPSNAVKDQQRKVLHDRQMAYVLWAATPRVLRDPPQVKDFADSIGVSRQTIWGWERNPTVVDAIRFVVVQNAGKPEMVTEVLDMIHGIALDKGAKVQDRLKAGETWLKATGVMHQNGRENPLLDRLEEDTSLDAFTDSELQEMIRRADEARALQSGDVS